MVKHIAIIALIMALGTQFVMAEPTPAQPCDPYQTNQSDFSIDTSALSAPAENEADAFAMQQIGINPQVLLKIGDHVSGIEIPTADFANPETGLSADSYAFVSQDVDVLNLFGGACTEAPVIAELQSGTQVTVLDGPIAAEGLAWWRVRRSNLTGWVIEGEHGEIWLQGSN